MKNLLKNSLSTACGLCCGVAVALALTACSADDSLSADSQNGQPSQADAVQFSTYMGRSGAATRGGAYGTINTTKLGTADYGFGVFAYQTGTADYNDYRTRNAVADHYPNFMYNERIVGDGSGGWKYADVKNTKYWPNELAGVGAVDDQNGNSGNDPATTANGNGGKVSFFAYAPYTQEVSTDNVNGITGKAVLGSDHDGTTSGIVAFSGNLFNGNYANNIPPVEERCRFSDPYLKYVISSDNSKQVDLLWGTTGTNGVDVLGNAQLGVAASSYPELGTDGLALTSTRPTYNVNADLTKQKTQGTVHLLFKHALAKIGGSYVGTTDTGSDEDASTPTNGLLVILDIDKDGEEQGGSLQPYAEGAIATTPYNTKVTINEVVLESEKQLTADGKTAIESNATFDYTSTTYVEDLYNTGIFNLVTGVWHDQKTTSPTKRTQTILTSGADFEGTADATDELKDAVLHENVAEPLAHPGYTKEGFESLPIGVTTIAKNVYKYNGDAQPFVFIPGTLPIVTITVDYTVRTYDAKLAKKYSEVRQKVTKRLYILSEIQLNKQYNILMHLGLTSVKFTATVSDWEAVTPGSGGVVTPGGGESPVETYTTDVEHVYLPINVK